MKNCPYCAEEIRDEAIKCRWCGEWLDEVDDEEREGPTFDVLCRALDSDPATAEPLESMRKRLQEEFGTPPDELSTMAGFVRDPVEPEANILDRKDEIAEWRYVLYQVPLDDASEASRQLAASAPGRACIVVVPTLEIPADDILRATTEELRKGLEQGLDTDTQPAAEVLDDDSDEDRDELEWAPLSPGLSAGVPRCPTCGSTDVRRITAVSKLSRVALMGVVFAAPKALKSYECLTCKARW